MNILEVGVLLMISQDGGHKQVALTFLIESRVNLHLTDSSHSSDGIAKKLNVVQFSWSSIVHLLRLALTVYDLYFLCHPLFLQPRGVV